MTPGSAGREEAAKVAVLRRAAEQGWSDLASGRFDDVDDDTLDDFILRLGAACRRDGDVLVVGRVLHDAMELRRHLGPEQSWE